LIAPALVPLSAAISISGGREQLVQHAPAERAVRAAALERQPEPQRPARRLARGFHHADQLPHAAMQK
jgi:hypothetical protein